MRWGFWQGVVCALALAMGREVTLNAWWSGPHARLQAGMLIAMLLGVAPAEELWFPGFLLPQRLAKLRPLSPRPVWAASLAVALTSLRSSQ